MAGAHRCSNCNLNYPIRGLCEVCAGELAYLSTANVTNDLEEEIARKKRVAAPLIPEPEKIKNWRQEELLRAGYPWDYAVRIARDREIDLHRACETLPAATAQYGAEEGLRLTLEILL